MMLKLLREGVFGMDVGLSDIINSVLAIAAVVAGSILQLAVSFRRERNLKGASLFVFGWEDKSWHPCATIVACTSKNPFYTDRKCIRA